jgi:ribosomal protein S18 acetylase RimI-like enzyme
MAPEEFAAYLGRLVEHYAASHVRAGRWTEEQSRGEARKEVDKLLPEGLRTAGHYLFDIVAGAPEQNVGVLWVAIEPRGAFVYDLEVDPAHRRHGYAAEAMRLAERVAREHGARRISLHVFGDNAGARRLYARLGYAETNVLMAKSLDEGSAAPPGPPESPGDRDPGSTSPSR